MSTFICALTGHPCEEPVVSPVSGTIFEKRAIYKYLEERGCDPINEKPLAGDELISLSGGAHSAAPRTFATASVPGMLKALQDEYEVCLLNNFTLRQQLMTARQELSDTLYKNDAAARVIARLGQELNAARDALSTLRPNMPRGEEAAPQQDVDMEEEGGITEAIKEKLDQKGKALTALRKSRGRKLPEGLTKAEEFSSFEQKKDIGGLHSTENPTILSMDAQEDIVVTGGADKQIVLFDTKGEHVIQSWKGHTKKISTVVLCPDKRTVVSAAADGQIRVWQPEKQESRCVLDSHAAAITGISLHPLNEYVLSVAIDGSWAFSDIEKERTIFAHRPKGVESDKPILCGEIHPDGLIFGTGTEDSVVRIWDLRQQLNAANFPGHSSPIKCLTFSEIGYHLATGSEDGTVKLWDLRKLDVLNSFVADSPATISSLSFDNSGAYLGIGSNDLKIMNVKPWQIVAEYDPSEKKAQSVNGVKFGANAASFMIVDKVLRLYGKP